MLILFEGIDGSGKTTQATLLTSVLKQFGIRARYLKSPGSTALGIAVRKLVKNHEMPAYSQTLLFLSAMQDLTIKRIIPLRKDHALVLDRYYYSTMAYGVYGSNINRYWLKNTIQTLNFPIPDLIFFMRVGLEGDKLRDYVLEQCPKPDLFESKLNYEHVQTGFGLELPPHITETIHSLNPVLENFYQIYSHVNRYSKGLLPVDPPDYSDLIR